MFTEEVHRNTVFLGKLAEDAQLSLIKSIMRRVLSKVLRQPRVPRRSIILNNSYVFIMVLYLFIGK